MNEAFARTVRLHDRGYRPIVIAMKFNFEAYLGRKTWTTKLIRRMLTRTGREPRL
jgi:hypothetical protein